MPKTVCALINEERPEGDRLVPRLVGPLMRELGLKMVRKMRGFVVNLEASGSTIGLMRRQYPEVKQEPKAAKNDEANDVAKLRSKGQF